MVASLVVIVGKDHDLTASEVLFATGRQTVTTAAEGEGGQADPRERFHIFLAFGPVNELVLLTLEWVAAGKVRDSDKTFWLAILPARRAVDVRHAIDVHRVVVLAHDLDSDRNAADAVDVPALLVIPDARTFIAGRYKTRLAVLIWRGPGRECRSRVQINRRRCRFPRLCRPR